jgi:4-amino-4-deoxy-L-arabinose transferase-like glycosyltransferase
VAAFAASTLRRGELRARWAAGRAALDDEGPWWVAVGGVTVAALIVRIVWLNAVPPIFSFDEGSFAQEAAFLWEGSYRATPFGPAWLSHPRLFFFMLAPSIGALGRTPLAARLPVAVLGAVTIPAVYVLGKELFGRRIGLMAAIFLVGWNIHIHFSRVALNNAVDPLFGTLAFALVWRALRTRRLSDWGLAGLALGFSQYFYAGARLLPVILVAWLAVTFFLRRKAFAGGWRDDLIPGMAVLVLAALVITWPANWHLIAEGAPPTTRLAATGLFQSGRFDTLRETQTPLEILFIQVKWAWLALIHTHDNSSFYGGVVPVMGRLAGVPLLIGMAWTTLRLRRRAAGWLLVFWLAATIMAGSALLVGPPHYARYVLLMPAAALLVALGIEAGFRAVASLNGEESSWQEGLPVTRRGAVAAAGILMAAEVLFYFTIYTPDEHAYAQTANNQLGYTVARLLAVEQARTPDLTVYYLTAPRVWLNHSTLVDYFAPGVNDIDLLPDDPLPDGAPLGPDTIFILTPERADELVDLRVYLPNGIVDTYQNDRDETLFLTFRAPER